jgi:hypothetical protein
VSEEISNAETALFTLENARDILLENGELALPGGSKLGPILGGIFVGAGLGVAGTYFVTRKKWETKYNELAETTAAEIAEMREHYQAKMTAVDDQQAKPRLEELVKEKGYSPEVATTPPMSVSPPEAVIEKAAEQEEEVDTPEKRQQVIDDIPEEETQSVFDRDEPQPVEGWDYSTERSRRSPLRPYVIHIDEREATADHYDQETFTYYEADDVVCNDADEVVDKAERENIFGEASLNKFGHGSGDPNKVYIRNDRMEVVIELIRSPNSYAEEVHGFQHSDDYPRQRRRTRFDDE